MADIAWLYWLSHDSFCLKYFLVGLPKESRLMPMKSVTCILKLGYLLATVLSRQMLQVRLNSEIFLFHGRF